ncbi:Protein TRANSPARENT TESTA 12 [Acorus calamus]|uniref:Protein TRANSPARENT TESTA 12 n=1 Tax=Acorus calamus TaxID=4465 RepID=A0AAV9DR53_ACOCL|nr:Protein TRANSPARENT TESTA 12 [Acorus calamus]
MGSVENGCVEQPLLKSKGLEEDIEEIRSCGQFMGLAVEENKKLWCLAGPAIFTALAQYSLGALTQVFAGHLTTLELDAVSVENMVIAGLAYGIMAWGARWRPYAGKPSELSSTACLGVTQAIARLAGTFSLYMLPQLLAYALNFPIQKFLQAQSKVMAMAWVSAFALVFHVFLSWLLIVRFGLGLVGAAVSLNVAWWVVVVGQFAYIAMGYCPGAWTGFSWAAFRDLGAFARLSVASAIMMCLEFWYYMLLVVLAGQLKNAQVAVAAISICTNLNGWEIMVFFGFNAAISVRISNELGAGRPRAAKLSILVVVLSSALLGLFFLALVLALRDVYGLPFTNSPEVARAVSRVAVIFSITLLLNSIQPVLTGVAVGAGWQWLVAYINVGCYYIVGLPLGFLLGSVFDLGVQVGKKLD